MRDEDLKLSVEHSRDCLDNVSQRLGLQQPDLFGLKYVSRRSYPKIRWVDLERPLKKQLDKYSTEPYLFLGVIFYVTDVSLLEDEITRYHYFLQLKMDVVEGRLRCNHEQAIVLASYSLQAEFGDHDPEKHTAEYLKDFPLLPKPMVDQFEDRMGALNDAVVMQHASLAGIAQQLAEVLLYRIDSSILTNLFCRSITSLEHSSWRGMARSVSSPRMTPVTRSFWRPASSGSA